MKSYYHQHESAYQQIKSKGFVGWGNAKNFSKVDEKFALDLGCGSGTTAFIIARHGFTTTGIDISATSLEIGRDLARQQNLEIQFVAGDVLNLKIIVFLLNLSLPAMAVFDCYQTDTNARIILRNSLK